VKRPVVDAKGSADASCVWLFVWARRRVPGVMVPRNSFRNSGFAAVCTERAALRALSEHGSAEPDPSCTLQGLVLLSDGPISRSFRDGTQRVNTLRAGPDRPSLPAIELHAGVQEIIASCPDAREVLEMPDSSAVAFHQGRRGT